jgi:hypothetical protein
MNEDKIEDRQKHQVSSGAIPLKRPDTQDATAKHQIESDGVKDI